MAALAAKEMPRFAVPTRNIEETHAAFHTLRTMSELQMPPPFCAFHRSRVLWWLPVLTETANQERARVYHTLPSAAWSVWVVPVLADAIDSVRKARDLERLDSAGKVTRR
jgi:hypothetical protein